MRDFVWLFIFFMTIGAGLIVAAAHYGPDPFRDPVTVDCIIRNRGTASYVCPEPR